MIDAAAYYREYKWRTLGLSYMEQVHARMAAIHATSLSVMEKLDLEDKILEEVSSKIAKRRAKRNKRKTR